MNRQLVQMDGQTIENQLSLQRKERGERERWREGEGGCERMLMKTKVGDRGLEIF